MYESFFNLQRRPFTLIPDPSCCFLAPPIQTIVDELVVCLERGDGIAVLTGPSGLGKTLVCQKVRLELSPEFVTIVLRHSNFPSPIALLQTLLAELKVPAAAQSLQELRLQVESALGDLRHRKQKLALICDEAHQFEQSLLEELRMLTDLADRGVPWVRLLLAGQFELEEKLSGPGMAALNQRLRANASLPSLTTAEALEYIDYRITWAGGRTEELFTPEALVAIAESADGVPRCLNQLCDHVLLLAYVAEHKPVAVDLVTEALDDLQHLPLNWNVRSRRDSSHEMTATAPHSEQSHPASVEFGEHLAAWESLSTSEASPAERAAGKTEVWEFGLDPDEPAAAPVELQLSAAREESPQPLLETRLERLVPPQLREATIFRELKEEPVIDRYAAIDGGWLDEALANSCRPSTSGAQSPKTEAPVSVWSDWQTVATGDEACPVYELSPSSRIVPLEPLEISSPSSSPEQRLHAEMRELMSSTQAAVQSRLDLPPAIESDVEAVYAVETATAGQSEARPLRNLFTRLRRKQKGLE